MPKKKIKAGELTLNQIVEIAEKYKGNCSECPIYDVPFIPCYKFCDKYSKTYTRYIKKAFKEEIEVEENGNNN